MYLSVRHFQHQLEVRHFLIYTDQKPLTFVLSSKLTNTHPALFVTWTTFRSSPVTLFDILHSLSHVVHVRLTVWITDDTLCHKSIQSTYDSLYRLSSPCTTHCTDYLIHVRLTVRITDDMLCHKNTRPRMTHCTD